MRKVIPLNVVETIREGLLVLEPDLTVRFANRSFCQTFAVMPKDTVGRKLYELGNGQWDIPRLRTALETIVSGRTTIEAFEVDQSFPSIGQRVMVLNARKVYRPGNKILQILLAIEDVTERVRLEREQAIAHERIGMLMQELTHRVKNSLQSIAVIEARNHKSGEGKAALEVSEVQTLKPSGCSLGDPSMANIPFDSPLAKKVNTFVALLPDELKCLAEMQASPIKVKRGQQLTHEGQTGHKAFVLQTGWACSYKLLPDGSRQIISFPIAGDIVGLRSILLRTADHSFSALTDAMVNPVEGTHIMKCMTEFPRLGAALMWAASRDEAMVVEHLVNIGRRNALERTAHFFMELAERLSLVGLAKETEFACPLSQYVIADALGLTAIHVNRVLRQLREKKLLIIRKGKVHIHDLNKLRKLAGFQGGYLNSRD